MAQHFLDCVADVFAIGVRVDHHAGAAPAAEQLVQRQVGGFGLDVPQGCVYRSDGRHRHRAAPPVSAFVEVLPDVFDLMGVAPDQAGNDMVGEVTGNRQFTPVQRGVANAAQAFVSFNFQRDKVSPWRADDDAGGSDFHGSL